MPIIGATRSYAGRPGIFPPGNPTRLRPAADTAKRRGVGSLRVPAVLFAIFAVSLATFLWATRSAAASFSFAGCAQVRAGGVCELEGAGVLRVWVAARPDASVSVRVDGAAREPSFSPRADGLLVSVDVPDGARSVRIAVSDSEGRRLASIPIASVSRPWLDDARAQRRAGKFDEAAATVAPKLASGDPVERALAQGVVARLSLSRGQVDAAIEGLRRAVDLDRAAGLPSSGVDDTSALVFTLSRQRRRYDEARAALDAARDLIAAAPEAGAHAPYYRGVIATETGDPREALRAFRQARAEGERLGIDEAVAHADNAIALTLELVGRWSEALERLRELRRAARGSPCDRADVATNVALGVTLARAARCRGRAACQGAPAWDEALAAARESVQLTGGPCASAEAKGAALTTLAQTALAAGDLPSARAALDEARTATPDADGTVRLAWLELTARLALANGDAKAALEAFDRERDLAAAALLATEEWRAETGRGEALSALGRPDEARAAFVIAEDVLTQESLRVPLGEGRARFLADREASARGLVRVLLGQGRSNEALAAARRAIARSGSAALDLARVSALAPPERERWERAIGAYTRDRAALDELSASDWTLAGDELAAARTKRDAKARAVRAALDEALAVLPRATSSLPDLAPGELLLALFPLDDDFVAFDADASGVRATRLPGASDNSALAAAWVESAASRIAVAKSIRVALHDRLADVDVHAAPFRGAPLLAHAPVVYALEGARAPAPPGRPRALLVIDPTHDLPGAREEGASVAATLGPAFDVTTLNGDAARTAALRAQLPTVSLFHYAGHAVFAGRDGWESAMPLAAGQSLTVGDVLSLGAAPRLVVLSSCEAARRADADAAGLSLAQAFVLGGSNDVVAPTRPVADALAAELVSELHRAIAAGAAPPAALQTAALALRTRHPTADWAAFRVIGR